MADNKIDKKVDKKVDKDTAKKKKGAKLRLSSKIVKFFRECKSELKKITWPSAAQTTKNFGIVLAVIAVIGLFIFGLDRGLYALLGLIMNVSAT